MRDWLHNVSLRSKLTLAITTPVGAIAVFILLFFPAKAKSSLLLGLEGRATVLARVLEDAAVTTLEFDDTEAASKHMQMLAKSDPALRYVRVVKADGSLFASFGDERPPAAPDTARAIDAMRVWQDDITIHVRHRLPDGARILLGVSTDEAELGYAARQRATGLISLVLLLSGVVVSMLFSRRFTRPVDALTAIAQRIASGDLSDMATDRRSNDEVGKLQSAIQRMVENLRTVSHENETERWFKTGQMGLLESLRGEQDLPSLCRNAVTFLAKYLESQVAVIFAADADGSMRMMGSYGFSNRKRLNNVFDLGEGIVGQVALERESILIAEAPEDHLMITTGLGESRPRNILAVPVIVDDEILGVVELASVKSLAGHPLELLDSLSENLAIAMRASQDRARVQELLEQTQRQSEELQEHQHRLQTSNQELEQQRSDLETANEELREQTEALRASEQRLQEQSERLRSANEELEEKTDYLEKQKQSIAEQTDELLVAKGQLEEKAEDLALANKYKSEFLANMSHELRTPLNSLLILSKCLADNDDGNLLDDQIRSAQIIHDGGQDLLTLINDILDLSKVEAGMMSIQRANVELDTMVVGLEEQFEPLAGKKNIEFVVASEPGLHRSIETDGQRLRQILTNLIGNAIKFTEHGSVTLRMRPPAADVRLKDGLSHDACVAFCVEDTGIGISGARQKAIFEAFQQADGGTGRKYGGTGLGLSISRELVRLLGGEIRLHSEPGVGSTFTVYLPTGSSADSADETSDGTVIPIRPAPVEAVPAKVETPAQSAPETPEASEAEVPDTFIADDRENVRRDDKSILIVEDDPIFASLLVKLARKQGFKCVATPDGASALRLVSEIAPSAVLFDLGLPDMPGLNVLEQLKYDLDTRHVPIHIISGEEPVGLQQGAVGFLRKPASADDVRKALARLDTIDARGVQSILVAQHEPDGASCLSNALENATIDVTPVGSGAELLERLKAGRFDCIVVDRHLPDMNALDVVEQISAASPELPPVLVYAEEPLSPSEATRLQSVASDTVVKTAPSVERVVDEATLFLHSLESSLSPSQRKIVRMFHDPEALLHGRRILLVDDDMRNTFALSSALRKHGLEVSMADNGQVALDKLDQEPGIELVLMDIMMPVMDGYEAIRQIRSRDRFADLPIVALTAKAMVGDRAKCIAVGANDYMTKPVDLQKLLSLLRVWLFEAA